MNVTEMFILSETHNIYFCLNCLGLHEFATEFSDKILARVPRKPISANRGLNLANRGIHFVPRLDPVPESMINFNLGIN